MIIIITIIIIIISRLPCHRAQAMKDALKERRRIVCFLTDGAAIAKVKQRLLEEMRAGPSLSPTSIFLRKNSPYIKTFESECMTIFISSLQVI